MVNPIGAAKGAITLARAARLVLRKLNETSPSGRIREAMEIEQRSWRAARDAEVAARLDALEVAAEDRVSFEERLVSMVSDAQFVRLQANVEYEALREATDERRRMLAYAAAGLADPSMPLTLKARIERTLRGLDPIDVVTLRRIVRFAPLSNSIEREHPISFAALISAGCIQSQDSDRWEVGNKTKSTQLGLEVVRVLGEYEPTGEQDA